MMHKTEIDGILDDECIASSNDKREVRKRTYVKRAQKDNNTVGVNDVQNDSRGLDDFLDQWDRNLLPDVNDGGPFHFFWASSTNKHDPVERYLSGGYSICKMEDVPRKFHTLLRSELMPSGQVSDRVMRNEMVLLRCPRELFERRMHKYNYLAPLEQQQSLKHEFQSMADRMGIDDDLIHTEFGTSSEDDGALNKKQIDPYAFSVR